MKVVANFVPSTDERLPTLTRTNFDMSAWKRHRNLLQYFVRDQYQQEFVVPMITCLLAVSASSRKHTRWTAGW